ncbi:MAG: ribonuclease HII [Bacteroidetes bacterium]|nr:ribonuclease HII [Bacteroidota bacterium]
MIELEAILWKQNRSLIAGVDEVGRGALAGPVFAAAVILPPHTVVGELRDSKSLLKHSREDCLQIICNTSVDVGIGCADPSEIDDLNILHASLLAMRRAIESLDCTPDAVLVDGNQIIPNLNCPQLTLVKGDQRSQSIAGASIVAKVLRDQWMEDLHHQFPEYGWNTNVGYPTKSHYSALLEMGPTIHHRHSFRLR